MLYEDAEETTMTTRTQLKAGKLAVNHSEALQVRLVGGGGDIHVAGDDLDAGEYGGTP